jgi:hypothetical protein
MGIGPVFAVPKVLKRLGLTVERHRPLGTQRSLRRSGAVLRRHGWASRWTGSTSTAAPSPSATPTACQRPAPDRTCPDRRPAPRREEGLRDDVHRRRHGRGGCVRGAVKFAPCAAPSTSKLHERLRVESLTARARFADHSRETFAAVFETCERIAREKYRAGQPHWWTLEEPHFDGEKVILPQPRRMRPMRAYRRQSGMLSRSTGRRRSAACSCPTSVEAGSQQPFLPSASVEHWCRHMLTGGQRQPVDEARHAERQQKGVCAYHEFSGRFSGTMCLSEPQAGSSLSDITTRAVPDGPGL